MNHNEAVSFIWGTADLIRDSFKRGKYQDVILPLTVLRRIDSVLAPTKEAVLEAYNTYGKKLDNPDALLRKASGYAFYNTSRYDFERLVADPSNLAANLRHYITCFSPNMREVVEKFKFDGTIDALVEADLLYLVMERFKNVDLSPESIDNHAMGTVFEELIRKFNEALNENPGEHFTPRDVVALMVDLMLCGDQEKLQTPGRAVTVYDPCCGSGGLLTVSKDHILADISADVRVVLYGQEVNPETFAIAKSDMFMNDPAGLDADNIAFGSVLSDDKHPEKHFDYLIANPPYGKEWKRDQQAVEQEYQRGYVGRFGAGLPKVNDGQLLFVQHLVAHMREAEHGGSRVAVIMNSSPLGSRDAGSAGIRRWLLESDLVEAVVALPEALFYNTDIATYVWVLTNSKASERRDKVLLIDASSFWNPLRRGIGDKRRVISDGQRKRVREMLQDYVDGPSSRVFHRDELGYRQVKFRRSGATTRQERTFTERVPLGVSPDTYLKEHVTPYVPDAAVDRNYVDPMDSQPGRVMYEMNFNRYFLNLQRCRAADEVGRDIVESAEQVSAALSELKADIVTEATGRRNDVRLRDSGIPWLGRYPAHWRLAPLFTQLAETSVKNTGMVEDNLLSLSYGRIVQRDIGSNEGLLPESFETYQIVEPGDIVLRLTDLQNDKKSLRTGLVTQRGIITSAYVALRPVGELTSEYGRYLLHAYDVLKVFYREGGGVRQSMGYDDLRRIPLLIPPLDEQKRIVDSLDGRTQPIEMLVRELDSLTRLGKEYLASIVPAGVGIHEDPVVAPDCGHDNAREAS